MKFVAKSLVTAVLLSSLTVSPSYGLEPSDPNFSECSRSGDKDKKSEYATYYGVFMKFLSSKSPKTKKQKSDYQKLILERDNLSRSIKKFSGDVQCPIFTVDEWLAMREQRLNFLKTAEEYIVKTMQKYPITTIQCFKNGILQDIKGINPVCPKGFKKVS